MEGDVRVRAVVMTRDDSSGGWVPLGGGGLSHVIICKGRSPGNRGRRDYVIRGERLRDRAPVLECAVQKGLVYNKVNPIFHHWRVEDRKFGLTFQSPADAITFERGLQSAIERLDRESESPSSSTPEEGDTEDDGQASHTDSESSSNSRKEMLPKSITIVTSESSAGFVRSAAEELGYESGPTAPSQSPSQIHTRPVQHQPPLGTAVLNPPAPPPPPPAPPTPPVPHPVPTSLSPLSPTFSLLEEGDLQGLDPCKDLWGSRGYEDYRRAGATRPGGGGFGGGLAGGIVQDKSELCVVRFDKELAGMGMPGCEVTINLDSKGGHRHSSSSPTCGSTPTASNAPPGAGSPQDTGKGSPSPCCIHTSLATPRSRTRKRGGGGGGGECGLGLSGSASLGGAVSPEDESPCPAASSSCSSRCVYCRSVFSASENGRGRCRDAPDPVLRCLRQWTCVWCAESLLYHCTSDSEGEFWEPCSCEDSLGGRPHPLCCARWAALLALSLCVPCMCCYLPLRACLRCGERCGCCGGRHKAVR
ncbi:sprouty-related, EVH1 domain-containing protein 3 isoform X2 [Paramormyrops kingsleyae]|uniref:Sprouty related EVH1 domain containing 3 n=1 Tax=Paramormyrops kingsleyae TaxID=1676925 RepID=A0A3B3STP9_9TELE|nr:sprouty-related, EVH1 domain-containing protein 3 isoform X2 [Paramormyrops kingsleyae]